MRVRRAPRSGSASGRAAGAKGDGARGRWDLWCGVIGAACVGIGGVGGMGGSSAVGQVISDELPAEYQGLEITTKIGERVPLDVELTDSNGKSVRLGEVFESGKPVVLMPGYFRCPLYCPMTQQKLLAALNGIEWTAGTEFEVVLVSFDPTEGPAKAAEQKAAFLFGYEKSGAESVEAGVRFLTGGAAETKRLCDAVGFPFRYLSKANEYSHRSVVYVLTPRGEVARYLSGLDIPPGTMKMSLMEASEGKLGGAMDQFIFYCFHWSETAGEYVVSPMAVMRVGAAGSAVVVAGLMTWGVVRERRRRGGGTGVGSDGRMVGGDEVGVSARTAAAAGGIVLGTQAGLTP